MAIIVSKELNEALKAYKGVLGQFLTTGSTRSYCSYVRAIENEMWKSNPNFSLLNDWILPQIGKTNVDTVYELLEAVLEEFDNSFLSASKILKYKKSKCRSALASFTKFVLGQYKANLYVSLDLGNDLDNCRLVARNALFCTVDVANKIKTGDLGARTNLGKGNDYHSWFCCGFQRKKTNETRGDVINIVAGNPDPQGIGFYILDDNTKANEAIKKAVMEGLPTWMKTRYNDFSEYMACHIWDGTCYDYRYHTSVFNLVLLPKSIGGLTDYCQAVKEMLQYESAMRFGVYPSGKNHTMSSKTKKIYKDLHNDWRQPQEHNSINVRNTPQPI